MSPTVHVQQSRLLHVVSWEAPLKVGIIGLPETGKTTLFNALTHGRAPVTEFGGRHAEANVGVISVPDARFDHLVREYKPKKVSPAHIEIIDGAAPIGVETHKDKFGTDFFVGIRAVDALIHIVRAFESPHLPLPEGGLDPLRDVRKVNDELTLADLGLAESRLERIEKAFHGKKVLEGSSQTLERDLMVKIRAQLEEGKSLKDLELSPDERRMIQTFDFLALKPMVIVANVGEGHTEDSDGALLQGLRSYCAEERLELVELVAEIEMEIAQLPKEEAQEYFEAMGITEPAVNRVVRSIYHALGAISLFTVGETEVHAWTVDVGTHAVDAAGKIHSDLARGFIRAEVIPYDDFAKAGSWHAAKEAGRVKLEGKEHVMRDGDIMLIRFKV